MNTGIKQIAGMAVAAGMLWASAAQAGRPNDPLLGLSIAQQGNQAVELIRAEVVRSVAAKAPKLPGFERVSLQVAGAQVPATVRCAE